MRASLLAAVAGLALAQVAKPEKILVTRVFPQPGQIGLFVAAADGSNEHPLVTTTDIDYDAVWSPDGASIVFTSERNGLNLIPQSGRMIYPYLTEGRAQHKEILT